MSGITGIHHITAIAGDAQENLDFYTGVLGMRLVKRSVNQDVTNTYHLFYADRDAHPGTDLTFFPWPDLPARKDGIGIGAEIGLAIPAGTVEFWATRLERFGIAHPTIESRRGSKTLVFDDPHGLKLSLAEITESREFTPWNDGPVAADNQIRGLHMVRLWEREVEPTASFLTGVLGFKSIGAESNWHRFALGDGESGKYLEVCEIPGSSRGTWGVGAMHHVAWRVPDDDSQLEVRERVSAAKRRPTEVIDRFWFKSVYFMEPGGVLFEVATDGPGFTVDEDLESLGESLVLPPWLERDRASIEASLPRLDTKSRDRVT
ncbi:MAG TPA: ring-cleaving dioxygenase [Gemmatimonadaceae bacterium]|nr:ring-cleaving dioxygenase [Gemmatimonadaceae bacterium]